MDLLPDGLQLPGAIAAGFADFHRVLWRVCEQVGQPLSVEEAAAEFAAMDADDGGFVRFDEFCSWSAMRHGDAEEAAAKAAKAERTGSSRGGSPSRRGASPLPRVATLRPPSAGRRASSPVKAGGRSKSPRGAGGGKSSKPAGVMVPRVASLPAGGVHRARLEAATQMREAEAVMIEEIKVCTISTQLVGHRPSNVLPPLPRRRTLQLGRPGWLQPSGWRRRPSGAVRPSTSRRRGWRSPS